jgi:hypothetical protein
MFSKHVIKDLSAYCHGELPSEQMRQVAEHLIGCNRCRQEFEEIKLGVKLAGHLPAAAAPDTLWGELEVLLDACPVNQNPVSKRRWSNVMRPQLVALAAVVLLATSFGAFWLYTRAGRATWDVASLGGTPRIGRNRIGDKGKLGVGQWLETDKDSSAQIAVAGIGHVDIDPNTRVRLLETKPTEHRLELAKGRLSARIWAPPKLFYVDTPSAVAEDWGCAYTLEVDDHGDSLLRVTLGWVALQLKDRESMVPAGAACATKRGIGPGTPFFEDASETFRLALSKLDFDLNQTEEGSTKPLAMVLDNARARDTLTLWHLLSRVNGRDRELVYERMAAYVPPPNGVTREGVLALNQQMLATWRQALELRWYDNSSPTVLKAWKKMWITGPGKLHGLEGKR